MGTAFWMVGQKKLFIHNEVNCRLHQRANFKGGNMQSIREILMERDGVTENEADELIEEARQDFHYRLMNGEMPDDICSEYFGLEPDYIDELI